MKPFCDASERNRGPILEHLHGIFDSAGEVLEIGSGTGQHAVHFARHLPHLIWHCSELPDRHAGIRMWLEESGLPNVRAPMRLDVSTDTWPERSFRYAFGANVAHIMSWREVRSMFAGVAACLEEVGRFALYGPFNYDGKYTSPGNRRFDAMLREEDPEMGLRDINDMRALGESSGLPLTQDHDLPANNRLLVFEKG